MKKTTILYIFILLVSSISYSQTYNMNVNFIEKKNAYGEWKEIDRNYRNYVFNFNLEEQCFYLNEKYCSIEYINSGNKNGGKWWVYKSKDWSGEPFVLTIVQRKDESIAIYMEYKTFQWVFFKY